MSSNITLITPTYLPDIERFAILRESIKKFYPGASHLSIVDYRHMGEFRDRFEFEAGLTLVSSKEVLPLSLVKQMQFRDGFLWRGVERVAWKLWLDSSAIRGWKIQQLAKIHALAAISTENGVFLDSDVFICRKISDPNFLNNKNTILLESKATNAEDYSLDVATYIVLKERLHNIIEMKNFIHVGATFKKRTARTLLAIANAKSNGRFEKKFLEQPLPSEYNMLGRVASKYEEYDGYLKYCFDPRGLTIELRYVEQLCKTSAAHFLENQMGSREAIYALLQSNLNIDPAEYKAAALGFINNAKIINS